MEEFIGLNDYDNLKPFIQDYLNKIEEIIINKEFQQNESIKALKNCKFTVLSISKELGCSKTTLYNHSGFLKRYIEISIDLFEENNPFAKYDKLKSSIGVLESKVDKMTIRDISTELLRVENNDLKENLKSKLREIERLQTRNAQLSRELKNSTANANTSNIRDFHSS